MMRCSVVVRVTILTLLLFPAGSAPDARSTAASPAAREEAEDLSQARALFHRNLDAIRARDRAAYLACYLDSESLARTGAEGPRLGYRDHAQQSEDSPWPDLFEGLDLRLVRVIPGIVYGTYRYRVRYGPDEARGLSERIFLRTPAGWKIAMTSAFEAPPGTPPPPRALTGAALWDGTGGPVLPDAVVVVRNGRIDCAGPRARCEVPEGIEVVDLAGHWIVPGLIDAHVHYSQTGWADGRPDALDVREDHPYEAVQAALRARPDRFFRSYLCSGVTATFDVGGYPWTWGLRADAEIDSLAPRVEAAGPLLSTIDHWVNLPAERQFLHIGDETRAREGARYLVAHDTSAVKVWFIVREEDDFDATARSVAAAGDEARALGRPLIVHATGLREAKAALRAGARMLVHSVHDQAVDGEFLGLAREAGAVYCPTLTVVDGYGRLNVAAATAVPPVVDDPHGCVDDETRARVASTARYGAKAPDAQALARWEERRAQRARTMAENLRLVHAAGIPIAMGTDAGNPLTLHGPSVYAEMEAMQAAGMGPLEVLTAATRGSALAMGRSEDLGTLEAGKHADLIVVAADPAATVTALRAIRWVMRGGELRRVEELAAPRVP